MRNKNPYEKKIQEFIAHYHMQTDYAVDKMSHDLDLLRSIHEEGKDKYLYGLNIFYGKAYTYVKNIYEEEVYQNGDYEHNIASSEEGISVIKEINSLYNTRIPEDLSRLLPD